MKKRILSIIMAICLVLSLVPTMAFAENGKHTVTVNAGEGGQVSTDGTSWSNSVAVIVNDGETLDGKVQYKTDEGYTFDGVVPKIVSVAAGDYHTVLLDSKGNVWTAGWNNCGQLGRDENVGTDYKNPTFTQVTDGISGVKITAIAAGLYHTVLLDADGNVWTAGSNYFSQLGRETSSSSDSTFTQVTNGISGVKITAIAAGRLHTVLLDADGNVWTAGYNNHGQLGRETSSSSDSTFTQVTNGISGVKITAIAAGSSHTVLLDANFNVWTAGWNYYGQLGRDENAGTTKPNPTFIKVADGTSGVKITAIAAGEHHTVLLDENNNVWTAGYNDFGQLGRDGNTSTFTQVTVGNGVKIKAIAAGGNHTVLLDANGNVWTAGNNEYGQLGRDENAGTDNTNPTFKQADVNPNAITFEELLNTPIYNNSVFLVKFKDIQCPVITGLENSKTYCDAVEFEVSDNDGIASVKAGNTELTESNGKYTLEKGAGTVTIVATDKAKNETTITVTVNDGHTYGEWQSKGNGTHKRYCTVTGCNSSEDGDCDGGEASYFNKAVCDTCHAEYGALLTDSTAPNGEITVGTNKWNSFLNSITFGLFFKNTQSVTVTATDDSYTHAGYTDDKAVKVEYYLYSGDTALTKADLASKTFTAYSGTFNINPDNKYVIYTRLTDHAGNVTYISSNGIVLDATVPVISGIENGKVYCEAQTVTVTEEYIESVKVNGTAVTLDANNQFTLNPAVGTQTIVVTDKAGNISAEITVTVNDGHSYEWQNENGQYWKKCMYCDYETAKNDIPTFTINAPDTVCRTQDCEASVTLPDGITDAVLTFEFIGLGGAIDTTVEDGKLYGDVTANGYPDVENSFNLVVYATTPDGFTFTVSKTVQIQNEHAGGVATCIELAICDTCGEPYGALDSTNHNLEKISAKGATVTETGNTEYWHCLDCDKYFFDENGESETKFDDTVISKLPPEIIDGNGQSVATGSNQPLTFRSNALFGDFIRFELDGETVDPMNYVVKEGSTIVTLNADYVATLSPGEHTIGIVSQSGTATATFTVNAVAHTDKTTKSPETGYDINTAMFLTLILSCGGVIVITGCFGKRKKHSAK